MKPLTPSAALAAVVGSKPLPRTQVVKKLWVYIKKQTDFKMLRTEETSMPMPT
jgi:chromatin remodeling complex protein RSC6